MRLPITTHNNVDVSVNSRTWLAQAGVPSPDVDGVSIRGEPSTIKTVSGISLSTGQELQGELMFGKTDSGKPMFWLQGQGKNYALRGADGKPVTNLMDAEARAGKLITGGGATQLRAVKSALGGTEFKAPNSDGKLRINLEDPAINSKGGSGVSKGGIFGHVRGEPGSALTSSEAVGAFESQGVQVMVFNSNPKGHVKNAHMGAMVELGNDARGGAQYARGTANSSPGQFQPDAVSYSLPKGASAEFKRGYDNANRQIAIGHVGQATQQAGEAYITGRSAGAQKVSINARPITTELLQKPQPSTPTTTVKKSDPSPKALPPMGHGAIEMVQDPKTGGVTGGRKSTASDAGSPDRSKPTRSPRRSMTERVRDISQKILKERFDGTNVSVRFMEQVKGKYIDVATPARDSDRLAKGCPTTVGDLKKLLGGLNNSVVSIKEGLSGYINVRVESKGFRDISLKMLPSPKGIDAIEIGEISVSGARMRSKNAATNEPMPDLDTTRQPLLGALLALKIVKFAEMHNIAKVSAFASFVPANPGRGETAYQGARFWPAGGFDGPIGAENVSRVQDFLRSNLGVAIKVKMLFVSPQTNVLDFLADSKGNLIPKSMDFWRSAPSSYHGSVNLSDKASKSYLVYQRALSDFGLK